MLSILQYITSISASVVKTGSNMIFRAFAIFIVFQPSELMPDPSFSSPTAQSKYLECLFSINSASAKRHAAITMSSLTWVQKEYCIVNKRRKTKVHTVTRALGRDN
jgi:hypothetical protein